MDNQQYIILFVAILIISAIIYFVVYKKDEEEENNTGEGEENNTGEEEENNTGEEGKVTVKITSDGVYVPDLPKTETYIFNDMPCDDENVFTNPFSKPVTDLEKEWCTDLGIPINKGYEVVGYSYDDLIDMDDPPGRSLFTKDKNIGCKYGGDKKGCVYVEKRDDNGNIIGIQNYKGDNLLDIMWNDLTTHTKMSDFFIQEINNEMEIKVENGYVKMRPVVTPQNCAKFSGNWFTLRPGVNIPTVTGLQYILLFLYTKGYSKDQLIFDINIDALTMKEIEQNLLLDMKDLEKDPNDGKPDMCTGGMVYDPPPSRDEQLGSSEEDDDGGNQLPSSTGPSPE